MSLQAKLDALKANFETKAAPETFAVMHKATQELIASGQAERALKAGDQAPAFTLLDSDGKSVSSADLLRKGPLVVTFYRGAWCPYCNLDLQAIEAAAKEIREQGAELVAISPQTAIFSRKAQRDNKLSFPILSDRGGETAATFGIRFVLPEYLREIYKMFKIDLAETNGEPSWTLPMPGRYVIAQDGVIAYAEVNPDYTRRPDPSELLPTLKQLARAVAA
ncbi:peroxiredoxin-like family protein [uncultured Nevskia sp.]|uniref:peroxiredoxin-like family protein n=1 Tax=uncultured Nevskia sp. TaxID=228950 RepID=UPI0025FE0542|nr:peroxiredoxin-like family protein [uncultured Nevskia sp.]